MGSLKKSPSPASFFQLTCTKIGISLQSMWTLIFNTSANRKLLNLNQEHPSRKIEDTLTFLIEILGLTIICHMTTSKT